jgi:hypothetical protein
MPIRLFLKCAALLVACRVHLRVFGFSKTIARARSSGALRKGPPSHDLQLARDTTRTLEAAATVFPGRARCLEQSLALYVILRRSGIPAVLRVGAQALPFAAHAWVELFGQPLNSDPEVIRGFVPFPDFVE